MYNNMDRRKLDNSIVRNMILKDKHFHTIKGQIPEDLYNRLINRKSRVVEEEKQIRIDMVKKLCIINNDNDLETILKGIEPLLKIRREIFFLWEEIMRRLKWKQKKKLLLS